MVFWKAQHWREIFFWYVIFSGGMFREVIILEPCIFHVIGTYTVFALFYDNNNRIIDDLLTFNWGLTQKIVPVPN